MRINDNIYLLRNDNTGSQIQEEFQICSFSLGVTLPQFSTTETPTNLVPPPREYLP